MRTMAMMGLLTLGWTGTGAPAVAHNLESTVVKVPFEFDVKNQKLPAGMYRVVLATQAKPGQDTVEVVVLQGMDTTGFAAVVATLESDGPESGVIFQQTEGRAKLREIHVFGKHLSVGPATGEVSKTAGPGEGMVAIGEYRGADLTVARIIEGEGTPKEQ